MVKKHKEETDTDSFVEEARAEKKTATEPWKSSGEAQPWRANYTRLPKTREGFVARWVRHDLVEQRTMQGYTLAKGDHYGVEPNEEGRIQRRELVLMEIPSEVKAEREANTEAFRKRQASDAKRQVSKAADEVNAEAKGRAVHVTDDSE